MRTLLLLFAFFARQMNKKRTKKEESFAYLLDKAGVLW
jgi:hypothetical protein